MIVPRALCPGEKIRVIAPSGWFDPELFSLGHEWLAEHYEVICRPGLFDRERFFAGSDPRRASELLEALADPDARAIVCARGGHGALRLLERTPESAWLGHPKWLIGFSDITVLHQSCGNAGVCSVHGANVTGLGRAVQRGDHASLAQWSQLLAKPTAGAQYSLTTRVAGAAEGTLVGGNLTLLATLAACNRLSLPSPSILLLEDVAEPAYRVDRALVALRLGGHLDQVRAVVLGEFVDCPVGIHGVSALDAAVGALEPLGIPIAEGLPIGHGPLNHSIVLGAPARLVAGLHGAELTLNSAIDLQT